MLFLLIFFFIFGAICGAPVEFTEKDLQQLLDSVPENERSEFLRFHVTRGYELLDSPSIANYESSPLELSTAIYTYYKNSDHVLKDASAIISVYNIVCFPEPIGCIDIDDPGIHPN